MLTLLAACNRIIDPYLIYSGHHDAWRGISRTFKLYARPHKAAQIERLKPDLLVLGTSRAFDGLPMSHHSLTRFERPYNAAIYDATLAEMRLLLQHAQCQGSLQQVIITLDFFTFNANRPEFQQQNLNDYVRDENCHSPLLPALRRLFSLSGLKPLDLLKNQKQPYRFDIDMRGEVDDSILLVDRRNTLKLIETSENNYKNMNTFYKDFSFSEASLEHLRAMLSMLHSNQIETVLLISPIHARRFEVLDDVIGYHEFENWKRLVYHVNSHTAQKYGKAPFAFWDFTDYNVFITEAIPKAYSTEPQMRFHWDTSHYRKSLGAKVWERLFSEQQPTDELATFGTEIAQIDLEQYFTEIRERRNKWLDKVKSAH